jgi:hypothetical protein
MNNIENMIEIIISVASFTLSIILAFRVFLLDKEYPEFFIIDDGNKTMLDEHIFERELGYTLTIMYPKIQLLKSNTYNIKITGIGSYKILPYKKNNMNKICVNETITFQAFTKVPFTIKISYLDVKNNIYEQSLTIVPIKNGKSSENSIKQSVVLSKRKWCVFKSMKNKYCH